MDMAKSKTKYHASDAEIRDLYAKDMYDMAFEVLEV